MATIQADSLDAFTRVYDRTAARVYGAVLSVVGDPDEAERITAEVYLAWWVGAEVLDPPAPSAATLTQLVTTAHRAAVEHVRHRTRDAEAASGCSRRCCAGDPGAGTPRRPSPVRDALASLPEHQRRVIELAYFGGHPCAEIERLLRAPPGSVSRWMREGVAGLRSATVSALVGRGDTMAP